MTNEQFSREYHLLDRLSQGAVVTHHEQSANGAMVMVHFLRASSDENAAIVRELDALMPERRARILTVVDVDGVTAIVTKFMLDFTSFQEWLASGARPPATPRVAATPSAEAGEFTQFFKGGASAVPLQEAADSPPSVASAPSAAPETPGTPGEFTLYFRGAPHAGTSQAQEPIEPIETAQPTRPSPSPAQPPGEFTQMFDAPMSLTGQPTTSVAKAPPEEDRRAAEPAQPVVSPASSLDVPPLATPFAQPESPSPPSAGPTFQPSWSDDPVARPTTTPLGPGEYTRFFGGPSAPPPAPSPLPPSSQPSSMDWGSADPPMMSSASDSYFGRLAGGPSPAPNFPPAPPQNVPPALPAFSGPSEFTRVISGPPPFPAPTPPGLRPLVPPPPVAPIGASAPTRDRILLFSLIGMVILAVVLVVVLLIAT